MRGARDEPVNSPSDVLGRLRPLYDRLVSFVDEGVRSGSLGPSTEQFSQWQAVNPNETATGPEITESSLSTFTQRTWTRAKLHTVNEAETWPEYKTADSTLKVRVGWMRSIPDWFLLNATEVLLHDSTRPCAAAEGLIDQAVELVSGAPQLERMSINLSGLLVASPSIKFDAGTSKIALRRPELAELQPVLSAYESRLEGRELRQYTLSAIATIDLPWKSPQESRVELERLQSLLRIVNVASVRYVRVLEEIVSPLHEHMGTLETGPDEHSYERGVIQEDDLPRIQALAAATWFKLPVATFGPNEPEPTPLTTAFRRYNDALLRDGTLLERRFASAVMGLESLFLPAKQDGELSYRLRSSVGRVLGEIGYSGEQVAEEVAFCYGLRSAYVHGGHIGIKLSRKADEKHGGLKELLKRLLDYLRASIIVGLVVDLNKEEFLVLVNRALVSSDGASELHRTLEPVVPLIRGASSRSSTS
jgi:hypothetical protein